MTQKNCGKLAAQRARAYDGIYSSWHAEQVTIDWFERGSCFFLDCDSPDEGSLTGNEIACALRLLKLDGLKGKTVLFVEQEKNLLLGLKVAVFPVFLLLHDNQRASPRERNQAGQ